MKGGNGKQITIHTVAKELGVSATTVSRAISGKGRVSEVTRKRVLKFISEIGYMPNGNSVNLNAFKTYNIGFVLPALSDTENLPFFQKCLLGACDAAQSTGYDILVVCADADNVFPVERLVKNKKVDGIILTRPLVNDRAIKFLKEKQVHFVVIGTIDDKEVYQVDSENKTGCKELISYMSMLGKKRISLIGGSSNHKVTLDRYQGFVDGLKNTGSDVDQSLVFLDMVSVNEIRRSVRILVKKGVDCIACMDDYICNCVLKELQAIRSDLFREITVASFYETGDGAFDGSDVYSLRYQPNKLGMQSAAVLLKIMNGEEVRKRTILGYEVVMRKLGTK